MRGKGCSSALLLYCSSDLLLSCSYPLPLSFQIMKKTGSRDVETELSLSADIMGDKWATDADRCGPKDVTRMDAVTLAECDRFHELAEQHCFNAALNLAPFGWFLSLYGFSESFRALTLTPTLITLFIAEDGLYVIG